MAVSRDAEFQQILTETEGGIRAFIAGLGVPLDTVDDIAQEVYLVLYRQLDRHSDDTDVRRWLRGVARNLAYDYFRKAKRTSERRMCAVVDALADADAGVEELALQREVHEHLRRCLERVRSRAREVVRLRYEAEMTSDRIGAKLGMSSQAVRVLLHRVRQSLKRCLESRTMSGDTAGA